MFATGRPWKGATTAGRRWPLRGRRSDDLAPAPEAGPAKAAPETHYRFAATATYEFPRRQRRRHCLLCRASESEAPGNEIARGSVIGQPP